MEPLSTYLEQWRAPTSAVSRRGDTVYVSGPPPFDPDTEKVVDAPVERQTELVLEQMKRCLEAAGSLLKQVLKCNVYCTSVEAFTAANAVYVCYFLKFACTVPQSHRRLLLAGSCWALPRRPWDWTAS